MQPDPTPNQRRFLRGYVKTGNGQQTALAIQPKQSRAAAGVYAHRTLSSVRIRRFVTGLLDAEGISDRRLQQLLAHGLACITSKNLREKALGLKALDMAMKMRGMYAPERVVIDHTFEGKSAAELEHFAVHGTWPATLEDTPESPDPES